MKIIAVVGPIGAGKTTLSKFLERLGYKRYSLSDILREEAKKRGLVPTREVLTRLGWELRGKLGNDALVKLLLERLREEAPEKVVVESVRWPAEVELLKRHGALCIAVDAPRRMRYLRILKRGRRDEKNLKFSEFLKTDVFELSLGLRKAMKLCDARIENSGGLEELYSQIKKILSV